VFSPQYFCVFLRGSQNKQRLFLCTSLTDRFLKNKRRTWCHLLFYFIFYFTSYVLNMFRTLIYPSSGACDYSVELPHLSYCSACNTDTSPTQPHRNSNTHRTKNITTNVVIQRNSRKLLMMDILMSETCWVHKKWNKIASDIKLVFYSSTITMMHGPINIRWSVFITEAESVYCAVRTGPLNQIQFRL